MGLVLSSETATRYILDWVFAHKAVPIDLKADFDGRLRKPVSHLGDGDTFTSIMHERRMIEWTVANMPFRT